MKTAILTHCEFKDGIFTLHNGFSFGAHAMEGEHIFIVNHQYPDLSNYDTILLSAIFKHQIPDNVDERWIIGGPAISNQFPDKVNKDWISGGATLCKESLENYLKIPKDDTFTSYWDLFISNLDISFIKYAASCSTRCYYNSCVYCNKKYNDPSSVRDISKVISMLPRYSFPGFCYLVQGSVYPEQLDIAIKNPTKNLMYRIHARADKEIVSLIEKAKDLSHIGLVLALENLSQKCTDQFNKNLSIIDTLKLAKLVTSKGGKILFTMISKAPIVDTLNTKQNLQYIVENLPPQRVMFWDSVYIEWPDENTAKKFGPYTIKKVPSDEYNHFIMDNDVIIVTNQNPDVDYVSEMILKNLKDYGYHIESRF